MSNAAPATDTPPPGHSTPDRDTPPPSAPTVTAEARAARDRPWSVPGRITTVSLLALTALTTLTEPVIALLGIVRDGNLRVSVIAVPGPIELSGSYTGVLTLTGVERTILYGYYQAPGWILALEGALIIAYTALVIASLILFGRTVAPTSPYWQGEGDPWDRIRCNVEHLRRTVLAAFCAYALFGWAIPALLSPPPDPAVPVGEDASLMRIGGFWSGLPFAVLAGVWTLTYFTEALHRLALRTAALAVENADLREETEGLV